MIEIYSKARQKTIRVDRIIDIVESKKIGPTLIFFGGIHGNEPAGVFALHEALSSLRKNKFLLRGAIIGIAGNMHALAHDVRYMDTDLNRIWTSNGILKNINGGNRAEDKEQQELMETLREVMKQNKGPFYFFDLHTTSGTTQPFITINDTILNRKLASQFGVPIILGIEEHLNGPILSYINEWGYVAIGYEAGQHDELKSIKNSIDFINKALQLTGMMAKDKMQYSDTDQFYEITYRYSLQRGDQFNMCEGFKNFQIIASGQHLAVHNGGWINARSDSIIFMPLYQEQGEDGYFLIKKIAPVFLKLSGIIRKAKLDNLLTWLPGISWGNKTKTTLQVNQKIARFFATDFLHLMGYRVKQQGKQYLNATKRDHHHIGKAYTHEPWV